MTALPRTTFAALRLWVLAWFVASMGVAIASPLVNPQSFEVICSGTGAIKLVVQADDGAVEMGAMGMACPLCATPSAPPPTPVAAVLPPHPLAHALQPVEAAPTAAATAAPPAPPRPPSPPPAGLAPLSPQDKSVFMSRSSPSSRHAAGSPRLPLSPSCWGVFATCALASLSVPAQTTTPTLKAVYVVHSAASPNGKLNLDTPVATGSRLGLTSRENPASVTVVDRATIDARGAQDTQEILRAVPGVVAHNAPGSMSAHYRGFTSNSVAQLYNGINPQYGSATRAVDSWIYDRVEAIGGA